MLRGIRNASSGWLGKTIMAIVMGVLIFSFAIWGIADVFKGFGQSTLAQGRQHRNFDRAVPPALQRPAAADRPPVRPPADRRPGARLRPRPQVLQQWIAEAALDEAARRMGLGQSDAEIMRLIHERSELRGRHRQVRSGSASPARSASSATPNSATSPSSARCRCAGRSPTPYGSGVEPPKTLLDALQRYRDEQRSIDYVKLGAAQAGTIDPPSPEALASYFDERKALFRAPEYRKIAVVVLTPRGVRRNGPTCPTTTPARCSRNASAKLSTPEQRQVLQMVFPNADEAQRRARDASPAARRSRTSPRSAG